MNFDYNLKTELRAQRAGGLTRVNKHRAPALSKRRTKRPLSYTKYRYTRLLQQNFQIATYLTHKHILMTKIIRLLV